MVSIVIRILIKWDFVSPSMETASGTVTIHHCKEALKFNHLADFKVRVTPGNTGYFAEEGKSISTKLLDSIRPILNTMIKQYLDGICLKDESCSWLIEEELTFAYDAFETVDKEPDKYKNVEKGIKEIKESEGCKS